ncbi:MAG TPA: DUF4136 domain-containing protein [Cyclobacteriaceae bacterium]|nr:DUF4136 domain-containing protein [Cyclobacteriaceae bacterium]
MADIRKSSIALLAGIALLYVSCSTSGVTSHSVKSKGVDLKKYKTFAWVKPADAEEEVRKDDKLYGKLILQLCNEELSKKGFVLDTENPDAVFMFDTRVEDRVSYSQTPQMSVGFGFGGPGYYGGFAAPVAGGDIIQHNYQHGMMFIEMYDTKTQKVLWKGWAEKKITYESDIESDIHTAVKHIFMRLSVKHK